MRLAVVIVNYRTSALAAACLRSLADQIDAASMHVVVVDNASNDGSAEELSRLVATNNWSQWATVLPLATNRGYAAGNNAALRMLLDGGDPADLIWFLNPDCVVQPEGLSALLEFMDAHANAAIVGSRLLDGDGGIQVSAFRFHSILSELVEAVRWGALSRCLADYVVAPPPPAVASRTDWVAGASMVVRRDVFERIGLLDEEYFLYFEDVDFCLRAARVGFECWYVPASRVVHFAGSSTGVTAPARATARRPAYWFHARQRYFRKNFGPLYTLAADLAFIAGFALWRVRRLIQRKPDRDPARFVWDFLAHSSVAVGWRGGARSVGS